MERNDTYMPMETKVVKITDEAPGIKTFRLEFVRERDRKKFDFLPGQLAQFSLMGVGEAAFSMCSSPDKKYIEISVRNVGNVTSAMFGLVKGDTIGVRGPYGRGFPLSEIKGKNVVIVAGGIGFPPLASAMEYMTKNREDYGRIWLVYGVKEVDDLIYSKRMEKWADAGRVEIIQTVEKGCTAWDGCVGMVTQQVKKLKIKPEQTVGLSCGPPVMLKFVSHEMQALGIDADDIHLSMERMMQCGIGKCGHCNIGDKYVCRDGPVFTLYELRLMQEDVW